MAILSNDDMTIVWKGLMAEFSSVRREIPVSKHQFRMFLENVDEILEGMEVEVVQSVPAGSNRQWLIDNPVIGRSMIIRIIEKRREVL